MSGLVQGILTAVGGRQYATWSTTNKSSNIVISGSNLVYTTVGFGIGIATIGKSTGKWYWEVLLNSKSGSIETCGMVNFVPNSSNAQQLGPSAGQIGYRASPWAVTFAGAHLGTATTAQAAGQIISFAFDADAGTLKTYLNGSPVYTVTGIPAGTWYPACAGDNASAAGTANFGSSTFTYYVSSGAQAGGYNQGVYN